MTNLKSLTVLIKEDLNNGPKVWGKREVFFKLEIKTDNYFWEYPENWQNSFCLWKRRLDGTEWWKNLN